MQMIEVKAAELIGPALDWAVDWVVSGKPLDVLQKKDGSGEWAYFHEGNWFASGPRKYSSDWAQGGPLIQKYGVLLSPPSSLVHRNFGNFDKRNGYYESGFWGATIFAKERKHRRKAFEHPDQPLVVVMRAIVQFELGEVVSVPAELVSQ